MNTSHAVEPVFCGRIVSFIYGITYLYGPWIPAICCCERGVSMCGSVGSRVVGELHKQKASYPVILMVMAVDPEVLFEYLDSQLTQSVCLWVVCYRKSQPYIQFLVEGLGEG